MEVRSIPSSADSPPSPSAHALASVRESSRSAALRACCSASRVCDGAGASAGLDAGDEDVARGVPNARWPSPRRGAGGVFSESARDANARACLAGVFDTRGEAGLCW